MKWFTAVGAKMESQEGVFRVRAGTSVKDLLGVECYIWNTLLWSFVEEEKVYERMLRLLRLAFPTETVKTEIGLKAFQSSFQRLQTRGLVTFREADTWQEAEKAVFRESVVVCVDRSFGERFLLFCEGVAAGGSLSHSLRVFQKTPLEREHREILKTIQDSGIEGFCLQEAAEEQLNEVIELHRNKLLFVQSVKGELLG